jgi:hypothetical protein
MGRTHSGFGEDPFDLQQDLLGRFVCAAKLGHQGLCRGVELLRRTSPDRRVLDCAPHASGGARIVRMAIAWLVALHVSLAHDVRIQSILRRQCHRASSIPWGLTCLESALNARDLEKQAADHVFVIRIPITARHESRVLAGPS